MLVILEALKTQVPGLVEGGALDPEEEVSILGASPAAWRGGWEHLHTAGLEPSQSQGEAAAEAAGGTPAGS